jgi:NADP-dependent 3-hydroxy acid dehydrogenase YdfG
MPRPTDDRFAGTWVLITGASSGIGAEFARQLAERRANLILTARSEKALDALAAQLAKGHGIAVEVVALDLGEPGGAARLCAEVERRGREVAHLISNAGFGIHGRFLDADGARQAEMVRLNCEAVVSLASHFLPRMVARGAGGVIHVASVASFQPAPYMAVYAASKAFVLSFSEHGGLRGVQGVRAQLLRGSGRGAARLGCARDGAVPGAGADGVSVGGRSGHRAQPEARHPLRRGDGAPRDRRLRASGCGVYPGRHEPAGRVRLAAPAARARSAHRRSHDA